MGALRLTNTACLRFALLVLSAHATQATSADIGTDNNVLIGTDDNFASIIDTNDLVFAVFYAPWCGHCKSLMPEFAKAAMDLANENSPIKLVKIDATVQESIATQYNVEGYPTMKLFKNGKDIEYDGGRDAENMIAYVKKKSGPAAIPLDSIDAAKQAITDHSVVVIGFFESIDDETAKGYRAAAEDFEAMFFITSDADIAAEYKASIPSVSVFADFDDEPNLYGGDLQDISEISTFVAGASLPLTMEFSDATAPKIFGGTVKNHLIHFIKYSSDDAEQQKKNLAVAAKQFRGQILFIYLNAEFPPNRRVMEFFGVQESDCPTMRIINVTESMEKFVPDSETTAEGISSFVSGYLNKNIEKHLKSQELPTDWDAKPVKILTGENFVEVALDTSKHVLVEFYAPWCGHCKQLAPVYEKVGEAFESNPDIVIAKIDATENEFEDEHAVESYPTLKLYPAGEATVEEYEGDRTLAAITAWLQEKTGVAVPIPIEAEEGETHHEEL